MEPTEILGCILSQQKHAKHELDFNEFEVSNVHKFNENQQTDQKDPWDSSVGEIVCVCVWSIFGKNAKNVAVILHYSYETT